MKKSLAILAFALLSQCAIAAPKMPESEKYYKLQHSSGLYLTSAGGRFFLADDMAGMDQAQQGPHHRRGGQQVFKFVKTPDQGDIYNIEAGNWRYLTSDPNWKMGVHANNATNYAKFEVSPSADGEGLVLKNLGQRRRWGAEKCALGTDNDNRFAKIYTNRTGLGKNHEWTLVEVQDFAFPAVEAGPDAYPGQDIPDGDPRKTAYPGYKLVFAQEFNEDGAQPDKEIWKYETGWCRNNEDQFYCDYPNNIWTEGGVCVFNGRREPQGEVKNPYYGQQGSRRGRPDQEFLDWTSSSIITKGEKDGGYSWQYGIYEVRAKVPAQEGTWPAIWSTGQEYGWPKGGEIDLMEWYENKILGNVCWGNQRWNSKTVSMDVLNASEPDGNWADKYHVWRMIWDPQHIEMWCDDVLVNDIDLNTTFNEEVEGQPWSGVNPFRDVRQCLWLNLALGGDNGGSLEDLPDNNYYLVDYARVYQEAGSDGKATYSVEPYGEDATILTPKKFSKN